MSIHFAFLVAFEGQIIYVQARWMPEYKHTCKHASTLFISLVWSQIWQIIVHSVFLCLCGYHFSAYDE